MALAAATLCGPSPLAAQTSANPPAQDAKPETHITPEQAKQLFSSVDTILQFASSDTKLAIKSKVKRRLTTRDEVEKYLVDKMKDDKDAKRMERSEIVLKKFGLLDESFHLQPFLVSLLKEQIAGYYDAKTKTVNLLDWIDPEQQKPVLAHELTHALQDQRLNLDKWEDSGTEEDISRNVAEDNHFIELDEQDTAREAVLEGQAMAVLIDYSLKPAGQSILTNPDLIKQRADEQGADSDSPVLSRAPLLLQESLLFPYREGLKFEVDMLTDKGPEGAFAGVLDHPPSSSYEIMNPRAYERNVTVPVLKIPDIHPLLDADYAPYDIGVMGQIDVRILSELFGGQEMAAALAPAWDGGIYYAAQKKKAADKNSTASIGLLYLSQWKSERAAQAFAKMYAEELDKQFSGVSRDSSQESDTTEQVYQTNEGPVLITTAGRMVFVSESFDLQLARKLELLMTNVQKGNTAGQVIAALPASGERDSLTAPLTHFLAESGMMRAALPSR
ncbi:hypothetical protein ESZ00_14805 [Silvibacterium dinghuense]|uniref:Uncharacterized protein n=1 Tax=Silvibacterium dinghuense TaxID=1560006 RepID=A0A4Q1SCC6_9BACT|nr:hypothetical protein ESZ00_14805 [Silvibacterium dinghuense]